MYGDDDVIRHRIGQLREQGTDLRSLADQLVARVDGSNWTGRAGESLRGRVRDRAALLRASAGDHDTAADTLAHHLTTVEDTRDTITGIERRAGALLTEARARAEAGTDDPSDAALLTFTPPPAGHRDWLDLDLPGLR
ncbi:hypothetical protein [Nocardioides limicola]|uniref:hypothetical protein n=1 Tax=Nocardioides limicola TaxID=2803368 RepID=UPI00193BD42D|nr:hypothetical protein [Nocardioides sp. DJM-14]